MVIIIHHACMYTHPSSIGMHVSSCACQGSLLTLVFSTVSLHVPMHMYANIIVNAHDAVCIYIYTCTSHYHDIAVPSIPFHHNTAHCFTLNSIPFHYLRYFAVHYMSVHKHIHASTKTYIKQMHTHVAKPLAGKGSEKERKQGKRKRETEGYP